MMCQTGIYGLVKMIKYMFPKAHAAAYVMMMWRIAYCKIFYPLAFYAAYFSIRAAAFSYELMCQGKEALERHMADYESRMDTLSPKGEGFLSRYAYCSGNVCKRL